MCVYQVSCTDKKKIKNKFNLFIVSNIPEFEFQAFFLIFLTMQIYENDCVPKNNFLFCK